MFTGHKYITDKSRETGFDTYLLIDTDYGDRSEVFGIDENTPLDIETLVREAYREYGGVSFQYPPNGGPNYAAIITDN